MNLIDVETKLSALTASLGPWYLSSTGASAIFGMSVLAVLVLFWACSENSARLWLFASLFASITTLGIWQFLKPMDTSWHAAQLQNYNDIQRWNGKPVARQVLRLNAIMEIDEAQFELDQLRQIARRMENLGMPVDMADLTTEQRAVLLAQLNR